MKTIVKSLDRKQIDMEIIEEASQLLREGKMVAFPTETVYGLGADGLDANAAAHIYEAKGRPSDNPLIIHIAAVEQLETLTAEVPRSAKKLIEAFWPGPLTMIFNKSDRVPKAVTGNLDTVAVRMPNDVIALELLRHSNICIAAPSANTSGRPSPTEVKHVIEDLEGKVDMIIDGGKVGIGIESTIVDVTVDPPMILRPGSINKEMLEQVVGMVDIDQAIFEKPREDSQPKAPGMKYRHYAPKAQLSIYEGKPDKVAEFINKLAQEKVEKGYKVGIITADETKALYLTGHIVSIGNRCEEDTIANNLYGVLRDFDEMKVDYIFCEAFNTKQLGTAIMNRLSKAAGYHIEKIR